MKRFKGTTGKMSIVFDSQVIDDKGFSIVVVEEIQIDLCLDEKGVDHRGQKGFHREITAKEVKANAELVVDAFNTIQDCNRLPSQILSERNKLFKMVKDLRALIIDGDRDGDFYDNCKDRILLDCDKLIKRLKK